MERPEQSKRETVVMQTRLGEDIRDLAVQVALAKQIDVSEYIRSLILQDLESKGLLTKRLNSFQIP